MPQLIPLPTAVDLSFDEAFVLSPATSVRVSPGEPEIGRLARVLAGTIGVLGGPEPMRVEHDLPRDAGGITLRLGEVSQPGDEAYDLAIAAQGVRITGRTPAGVFYGMQTLRQLLPAIVEYGGLRPDKSRTVRLPAGRIADSPRFQWRGAMLDVARHFFPVHDVKRFIDLMALHKLNRLHLHLADDQGWRLEIESWPNLARHGGSTQVGGGRGGFYTQQEYADLVTYARDRYVTVVPEIDMPGHTNAALASYPELNSSGTVSALHTGIEVGFSTLCVDNPVTYAFIEDVVREVAALTPGDYFHIGGDEVRALTPAQYALFIERAAAIVHRHGKRMIGWDEIAPVPLRPDTIVQHWRAEGVTRDAVARGAQVIMSPADRTYLDMKYDPSTPIGLAWAGMLDVRRAYDWDPAAVLAGVPESAVLGVEAPLWTETVATIRDAEFMTFPRLAALAEVAWTASTRRVWEDFIIRLGGQSERWTALGLNYCRAPGIPWVVAGGS